MSQQFARPFATTGFAFQKQQQSTELDDSAFQFSMIPLSIAMEDKLRNCLPERRLAKKDHPAQTFLTDGPDKAFRAYVHLFKDH